MGLESFGVYFRFAVVRCYWYKTVIDHFYRLRFLTYFHLIVSSFTHFQPILLAKLHPLDCVVFSVFKSALRSITGDLVAGGKTELLGLQDFCKILWEAYERAFTIKNAKASFLRAGMWPIDHTRLMCQPRPRDNSPDAPIVTVQKP